MNPDHAKDYVVMIRRKLLAELHERIPQGDFDVSSGNTEIGLFSLLWRFGSFRLDNKVWPRTLVINVINMPEIMFDLLLEDLLFRTSLSELPMLNVAVDGYTVFVRHEEILERYNFARYEIGKKTYYWREVTGQLPLF